MSLILDALNKSDRDAKQTGTAPTIHHHVTPPENDNKGLQPITLWLGGGLIFAFTLLVLVLLGQRFQRPAVPLDEGSVTPAQTANTLLTEPNESTRSTPNLSDDKNSKPTTQSALTEPAPSIQTSSPELSARESGGGQTLVPVAPDKISNPDPAIRQLYSQSTLDNTAETASRHSRRQNPSTPSSVSPEDEALAQLLWEQSAPKAPPKVKERAPLPPEETELKVAPEPATAVTHSIHHHQDVPFLHRLPEAFQNAIPSLMYAEHHFDQGFIVMNKKTVQVGEAAADGVTVEAILEDGAILSFKDRRFKLAAQSSWVNY